MRRTITVVVVAAVVGALVATPIAVYASHSFNDVPDTNTFHEDIAWLREAGVTFGCNPPDNTEYCPEDNVTREQMAAFMRRLAENQVVDAERVEGHAVEDLAPRAAFSSDQGFSDIAADYVDVEIEAPARGVLVMNAAAHIELTSADFADTMVCQLSVDSSEVPGTYMEASVGNSDGGVFEGTEDNICSTTGAVVVEPGIHRVEFEIVSQTNIEDVEADSPVTINNKSINVTWVPADADGNLGNEISLP
jgi:hypothetical protein